MTDQEILKAAKYTAPGNAISAAITRRQPYVVTTFVVTDRGEYRITVSLDNGIAQVAR